MQPAAVTQDAQLTLTAFLVTSSRRLISSITSFTEPLKFLLSLNIVSTCLPVNINSTHVTLTTIHNCNNYFSRLYTGNNSSRRTLKQKSLELALHCCIIFHCYQLNTDYFLLDFSSKPVKYYASTLVTGASCFQLLMLSQYLSP